MIKNLKERILKKDRKNNQLEEKLKKIEEEKRLQGKICKKCGARKDWRGRCIREVKKINEIIRVL